MCLITAEKGGVARAKGEGEKEKECTTEGKSRRRFWMVFIGDPRSETNMGGGDRIVLRSKSNYLRLLPCTHLEHQGRSKPDPNLEPGSWLETRKGTSVQAETKHDRPRRNGGL